MNEDIPVETLATIRTNTVTIEDPNRAIRAITYTDNSLVITKGQPYKVPPGITSSNGMHKITLEAGRDKTKPVADAFNSRSGGKAKEYAPPPTTTGGSAVGRSSAWTNRGWSTPTAIRSTPFTCRAIMTRSISNWSTSAPSRQFSTCLC